MNSAVVIVDGYVAAEGAPSVAPEGLIRTTPNISFPSAYESFNDRRRESFGGFAGGKVQRADCSRKVAAAESKAVFCGAIGGEIVRISWLVINRRSGVCDATASNGERHSRFPFVDREPCRSELNHSGRSWRRCG